MFCELWKNDHFLKQKATQKKRSCSWLVFFMCLVVHSGATSQELFYQNKLHEIDSIIAIHENEKQKKWLNLLPNLNYDLKNQTFNVGVSLNSFASFYQQKQRNKIEVAKLKQTLVMKLDSDLNNLNLDLDMFYFQLENLKSKIEIFKIEDDLFKISTGKYRNSEITIENFLELKKDYLSKKLNINQELFKLKYSAAKIETKAKNINLKDSITPLDIKINKIIKENILLQ